MKRLLFSIVPTMTASLSFAVSSAIVSNNVQVSFNSDKAGTRNTLTMAAVSLDAFPSELGMPTFWFDASQTNGWQIAADGTVVKVPSLVGDRYLTSDITEPGTSWSTWKAGNAAQTLKPPYFVSNVVSLGGGNAIDFGAQGAGRGLLFNAVEQSDGSTKSQLANIGTVVAVYDSTDGGGYFLSGGKRSGMDWGRDYNFILASSGKGVTDYSNLFVKHSLSAPDARGMYWQDDLLGAAPNGGLGGQWQVVAYSPNAVLPFSVGLGIGCTEEWYKSYSGGMKIAEMLIFDTIISDDDLHKISIWLQNKWFGRSPAGYNAKAHCGMVRAMDPRSGGRNAAVDVTLKSGETLSLDSFIGGRAAGDGTEAEIRVMGEGTLKVRDIRDYNGKVTLAGGKVVFGSRAVPTVETLPRGLFVRFDPSVKAGRTDVTENGTNYVKTLFNLSPMTFYGDQIVARPENPATTSGTPTLLNDALGTGLHVMDFGPNGSASGGLGRCLVFATNETVGAEATLPGVCTLVAVVGAQECGGNLLEGVMFRRGYEYVRPNDGTHTYALLNSAAVWWGDSPKAISPQKYGTVYIDGMKCASNAGYPTPSYHVVALQVPQCHVKSIGRFNGASKWRGGFRLGEMLLFNRPLSETELLDAQAYLMKKWFGRTLGGYHDASMLAADVQNVVVATPSAIEVPAGETLHIGKLTARTRLEKTGGGTLVVGAGSDTSGVVVREGMLKGETDSTYVTSNCELAVGDAFHLDAGSTTRIDFMRGHEDTKTIACWNDDHFRNCAYQMASTSDLRRNPTLTTAAELNGKPVVDFGAYIDVSDHGLSCFMNMEKPLDSVRSVYMVIGTDNGDHNGGNPIGTYYKDGDMFSEWTLGDFARGTQKTITLATPWFSKANENVKNGEIFIDGVQKTFDTALPNGGYQLVEVHTRAGACFSEIGHSIGYYDTGGFTLGELVVYARPLSEQEKVATRNYLLKKWFDKTDAELEPLPEPMPDDTEVVERELTVDADVELSVVEPRTIKSIKGDCTLTKTASAMLTLEDLSDFRGTLTVTEGSVKVSGRPIAVAPEMKMAGRILHLDAAQGVSVTTNADYTVSVNSWTSLLNDGWVAVPGVSTGDSTVHKPSLMSFEINDRPIVSMRYYGWRNGEEYMLFEKDGERAQLQNIRSVFWMIGSQEGGGILLGGGSRAKPSGGTTHRVWNRRSSTGQSAGTEASQGLIDPALALDDVYAWSDWYRNGEKLESPTSSGLTGGYDTLSMALWPSSGPADHRSLNTASADGLAFDGRELDGEDWRQCRGNQRLGELIIYDTFLSTEEQLATEAYLSAKWGLSQKCHTNAATVVLAEDTSLICENGSQFVDSVSGTGTVEGDVTIRHFVADGTSGGFTVDGTLTIPAEPVFEIRNAVHAGGTLVISVCTATVCEGVENLLNATFIGGSEQYRIKANFENGHLYVKLSSKGTRLIIR